MTDAFVQQRNLMVTQRHHWRKEPHSFRSLSSSACLNWQRQNFYTRPKLNSVILFFIRSAESIVINFIACIPILIFNNEKRNDPSTSTLKSAIPY